LSMEEYKSSRPRVGQTHGREDLEVVLARRHILLRFGGIVLRHGLLLRHIYWLSVGRLSVGRLGVDNLRRGRGDNDSRLVHHSCVATGLGRADTHATTQHHDDHNDDDWNHD